MTARGHPLGARMAACVLAAVALAVACVLLVRCAGVRAAHHAGAAAGDGAQGGDAGAEAYGAPSGTSGTGDALAPVADDSCAREGTSAAADDGSILLHSEQGGVEQVATRLLGSYRDGGGCALAGSGYLDLLGSVWGCVVSGDGWVDVCVVSKGEGETCRVCVARIESQEACALLSGTDDR